MFSTVLLLFVCWLGAVTVVWALLYAAGEADDRRERNTSSHERQ
jgi:hypothetical protein